VDADMVGHEVEDQADIMRLERLAQAKKPGFAPKLGIKLVMVDDVVAMRAAGARLREWRRIEVADAERLQIRHDLRCGVEVELL
jgi:hypothetical protein